VIAMANYYRRYKIITSSPVLFLFYGLGFGIVEQFPQHRPFSWTSVAFIGVPFGAIMTAATKRNYRKFDETTGLSSKKQQWEMHDTVRTGTLPTDPEIRKLFPEYLNKRIQTNQKSTKFSPVFLLILAMANILLSVLDKSVSEGLLSLLLVGLAIMTYLIGLNQTKKLNRLEEQLSSLSSLRTEGK
jgi:hypothetical protein